MTECARRRRASRRSRRSRRGFCAEASAPRVGYPPPDQGQAFEGVRTLKSVQFGATVLLTGAPHDECAPNKDLDPADCTLSQLKMKAAEQSRVEQQSRPLQRLRP